MLPEWGTENSVGRLYLLALRRHATEVALLQGSVEASLQRSVDVGQSHQILGFLEETQRYVIEKQRSRVACKDLTPTNTGFALMFGSQVFIRH